MFEDMALEKNLNEMIPEPSEEEREYDRRLREKTGDNKGKEKKEKKGKKEKKEKKVTSQLARSPRSSSRCFESSA